MADPVENPQTATVVDEVNVEKVVYPDVHWTSGVDLVPSPLYQVYCIQTTWAGKDDESLYNKFTVTDNQGNLLKSTVTFTLPEGNEYGDLGDNKYGYAVGNVTVTITPNATMKENYPSAIVNIDGKEFDLARLDTGIVFDMTAKDHFVDIHWSPLDPNVTESIRIVANR